MSKGFRVGVLLRGVGVGGQLGEVYAWGARGPEMRAIAVRERTDDQI